MTKPTVDELENILNGRCPPVKIEPNGEIKMDFVNCPYKNECIEARKTPHTDLQNDTQQIKDSISLQQQALSALKEDCTIVCNHVREAEAAINDSIAKLNPLI